MFYYVTHRLSAERTPGSMFYYVTHRLSAEHTPGPGGGGSGSAAAARAGSLAATRILRLCDATVVLVAARVSSIRRFRRRVYESALGSSLCGKFKQ